MDLQISIYNLLSNIKYILTTNLNKKMIKKKTKEEFQPEKITQLECQGLDNYFRFVFQSTLLQAFKYYPNLITKMRHEIDLIIDFFYYRCTVAIDQNQPGNDLQNIEYCNEKYDKLHKNQKLGLLLLDIILPYLKKKLDSHIQNQKLKTLMSYIEAIFKLLDYINLILFIKNGEFRSVAQRLLKIHMKFIDPKKLRVLDFSLMNRQIIWNVYEGFLTTVLPFMKKFLGGHIKKIFYFYSYMDVNNDNLSCIVCNEDQIVMPQKNNGCEHRACFYCVKVLMAGKNAQNCKICGKEFTSWESDGNNHD